MKRIYSHCISSIKKSNKLLVTVNLLVLSAFQANAQYCSSGATSTADDEIFNVTFGALNNTSACGAVAPGPGSAAFKYSNYTTLAPNNYVIGSNYPMSVTIGMCGGTSYSGIAGVWIDFNQNGSFTDPGEIVYMSSYQPYAIAGTVLNVSGGVTIPATATAGLTRMRVIETESSSNPGPCTNPTWGETEDYMINIVPATPFDLGVSALMNPVNLKKCFTNDTIVARVINFGTNPADFAVTPAVITVKSTGPIVNTYTLAINSGTLASYTTQDYTVTTNYNMTIAGNYNLKAYTTATGDGYAPDDTTIVTVQRKPFFNLSVAPNDTICLNVPVITTNILNPMFQVGVGTSSNTATTYPAPYGNYNHGAKHQFLILASELTSAGVTPGNITSVSFNALNINGSGALAGFNIGVASTTVTSLTAFQTGITSVVNLATYTPVTGINTHTFSTPFNWNGTSNLIVETCFNNYPTPNTSSSNVSFSTNTTAYTSSLWYAASYISAVCSNTSIVTATTNKRPDMYFDQPIPVTYAWSPGVGLSSASVANPTITAPASTTYTLTSNIGGACMSKQAIHIEIKPTPVPNLGSDSLVCALPLVLNPHVTGTSYLWNTNTTSSTLNINAPGKYWVRITGSNGCVGNDTVRITKGTVPIVTLGPDTAYCQGSAIILYGGNAGSSYLWSTGSTASSITVNTPGTYSLTVTHPTTCKASDAINITVKSLPTVGLTFVNPDIFCPTDHGRALTEGTPAGGTYIGSGITGTTFNAAGAGQGTYIILYNYTGPNGCSNIARDTLKVYACVGVEELENNFGLNVYPNPNNGLFTVELSANKDIDAKVNILTVDGRLVYNDVISGNGIITKSIDVTELANGIYYLRLETKDAIKTYKILKQ
ncbi:MAG: GEVED domain-containing protein [Bacteroidota bacterium]